MANAVDSFADRIDAGRRLAHALQGYLGRKDVTVIGLPRGGVPVAYEVARSLQLPLDVLVVRKLGVPGHEELAMGAIASGGVVVSNPEVLRWLGKPEILMKESLAGAKAELERREQAYRKNRPPLHLTGQTVIVIDDGAATGATMQAAVRALRSMNVIHIVVALPVAARESCAALEKEADEVICLLTPDPFDSVGRWYDSFDQTTDVQVEGLLRAVP
ncbi:MAG: phosphoribosyltransferase [Steroidobacteraceae bacterium]